MRFAPSVLVFLWDSVVLLVKASLPSFLLFVWESYTFCYNNQFVDDAFPLSEESAVPSDKVMAPRKIKLLLLAIYLQCMDVSGSRRRSQYLVDKILARIHNKVNKVVVILLHAGQFHLENRMLWDFRFKNVFKWFPCFTTFRSLHGTLSVAGCHPHRTLCVVGQTTFGHALGQLTLVGRIMQVPSMWHRSSTWVLNNVGVATAKYQY